MLQEASRASARRPPHGPDRPRALALISSLGTRYHLTQHKIRDLLAELAGVDFSVGAISQAHGKLAQALAAPVREAIASLRAEPILHMDEARYPREGSSGNWVWGGASRRCWPSTACCRLGRATSSTA